MNWPHEGSHVDLLYYSLKRVHHLAATIRTEELRQTSDMALNTRYLQVYLMISLRVLEEGLCVGLKEREGRARGYYLQ